jgi:ornithine carbamoyltransferase
MSHEPADRPALQLARLRHAQRTARRPRSLLAIDELDAAELDALAALGLEMKRRPADFADALAGASIALLFQKTSTRTRCAFEAAAREMGGHASYLDWSRSNFVLADLRDEAVVLSRFHDLVVARVDRHETLRVMADHGEVPVVNGLCDRHHPCQAISDMVTLREYFGADLRGLRLTWIGDGNNVCRSLVQAAALLGIETTLCSPAGHRLDEASVRAAGALVREEDDPRAAVAGADVVYTDTWVSMGQEGELAERLRRFAPLRVDAALMAAAGPQALFMHCLPAHPGQEVSAEVLRSPRSIVFDQAENRKHAQKALLLWLRGANRGVVAPAALAA